MLHSLCTKLSLIIGLLLVPLLSQVPAQSVNGRFTTSFYSLERQTLSGSETQSILYQSAQLTIGQMAGNRLSAHFFGHGAQGLGDEIDSGEPVFRLYNSYLQWHDKKNLLQRIRLGRQRLYSGVAYGTIDGVDLTLRLGRRFKVGGFAGLLALPGNDVDIADWDDRHALGLRVSARDLLGTRVLVSFMQRNRRPLSYTSPGRFTQRILSYQSLEQRLIGVDLQRQFSRRVGFYGRFDYDLEQERLRRGQVELKYSANTRLEVALEFFHRAPLLAANSIFTVFELNTTQDVAVRANYRFTGNWFVNGNVGFSQYDGDETVRFGAGLGSKYGSFGYNFRRGYGGQNSGAYAALSYPLTQKLGVVANTGLSRYRLFDEDADSNTSLTGSVGINYRFKQHCSFNVLGQGIRNRFLDNDFRVLVKANYWFFASQKK